MNVSLLTFSLVSLAFAVIALAIGFAIGVWYLSGKKQATIQNQKTPLSPGANIFAEERVQKAASQLRDLTKSVAAEIGEHASQMKEVNTGLRGLDTSNPEELTVALISTVDTILSANDTLQKRLAEAECRLQEQADEILVQQSEARTDALTSLANRRGFDDEIKRKFAEWKRLSTPFSLLIFDIDHFKKFNDTYGHLAGDKVLEEVGKTLGNETRDMDIPCRYGGEEFAIIMPATTAEEGVYVTERIRKAIENMTVCFEHQELKVTASVGLAQITSADDTQLLIKRSDQALYKSKSAGRNCSHYHDGTVMHPLPLSVKKNESNQPTSEDEIVTKVLNQLPNRSRFLAELRRRVSESHRDGGDLSVIHLEIVKYNEIKEERGVGVASLVLDSVSQFITQTLREMDLLGRMEYGQFMVMLPGSSVENAERVGRRIQRALTSSVIPLENKEIHLDILLGVTGVEHNDTAKSMIERAQISSIISSC